MRFEALLRQWMKERRISGRRAPGVLKVRMGTFYAWLRGAELPAREYWPRLIELGIATDATLKSLTGTRQRRQTNPFVVCPCCQTVIRKRNGARVERQYVESHL